MYEILHTLAETYGIDHLASTLIVVQLSVVGTGIAAHRVAHVVVFCVKRIRHETGKELTAAKSALTPPPPLPRATVPGPSTRRYTAIHPPRR